MIRLDTRISNQRIFAGTFITKSYKNNTSLVDFLLEQIPDLDIQPNVTRRGFSPPLLEEKLGLVDVPSRNNSGEMISILGLLFLIHCAAPYHCNF